MGLAPQLSEGVFGIGIFFTISLVRSDFTCCVISYETGGFPCPPFQTEEVAFPPFACLGFIKWAYFWKGHDNKNTQNIKNS